MNAIIKINEIVNEFLLAGEKFTPEMHLKQHGFTYSACGPFTKIKERIEKFKEKGKTKYIYRYELDKACFQHDMADLDCKYLARRIASHNVLRDKALDIAKNLKYDGYHRSLASVIYKFLDKKFKGSGIKNEHPLDFATQQLVEELHKPIIKKFIKRRVYS